MSGNPDPWQRNQAPPPSRNRLYIWIGVMVAAGVAIWLLSRQSSETSLSGYDEAWIVRLFGVLAVVSAGIVFSRRFTLSASLRYLAIWAGIAAVLAVCYVYQDAFFDLGARLRGEFLPSEPMTAGAGTVVLTESEGGSYYTIGEIDGVRMKFLVDTGSTDIVLSPSDAERIGVNLADLRFDKQTETANGAGQGASYTVDSLTVGPIALSNVAVSINQAPMESSLLGMAFLRRMKSFEFKDRKLYLHWR